MKKQRATTSERIMAIRQAAGNTSKSCPTCGRPPASPHRVQDKHGKIVEGCVDACHTGHLTQPSESYSWHHRREAEEMRRRELARISDATKTATGPRLTKKITRGHE